MKTFVMNKSYLNVRRIFKEEKLLTQHDIENQQLKEKSEKLRKENEQLRKNNVVKDANINESIQKPIEIKSLEEDKNTTDSYPNWFDKNKFKNILAITDSNKFNYRHKTSEFKYIDIKNLVNNIRNNTINEICAKKSLNTLNEMKNAGITKPKQRTPKQEELLSIFNNLSDTTLTDKTLMSSKDKMKMKRKMKKKTKKQKKRKMEMTKH